MAETWAGLRKAGRHGQSTLEYILVLAAIVAAAAIAAVNLIGPAMNKQMTDSKGVIEDSSGRLKTKLGL